MKNTTSQNTALLHTARTLPHWEELPDFDLYMDQVLSLMERYLGSALTHGDKGLTASMVNNYVKTGLVPAPQKKKYSRLHLASLIVVCVLKPVLPLAVIREILDDRMSKSAPHIFYDEFCSQFEAAEEKAQADLDLADAHSNPQAATVLAALNAQSQRAQALALHELRSSR